MIFKLAEAAEKSWRRLDDHNQLPKIILGVSFTDGMKIQWQVIKGRRLCKSLYFQISRFFRPCRKPRQDLSFCKALNELGCGVTFFLLESRELRVPDIDQHLSYFGADRFHIIERSRFYYFKIIFYVIWDRITKRLKSESILITMLIVCTQKYLTRR